MTIDSKAEQKEIIKKFKQTRDLKKNDESTNNPSDFEILCAIRDIENYIFKNCGANAAQEWLELNKNKINLLISKYQNGENHESV